MNEEIRAIIEQDMSEHHTAFDWDAAIAMCSQYSIEASDGHTFMDFVEDEFNNADDLDW
jgi:hypothetical protein